MPRPPRDSSCSLLDRPTLAQGSGSVSCRVPQQALGGFAGAREPRIGSPRGFSLIEVLAAFVILALVGTALFRLFSGALGNASLADEYSRAALYAESRLAGFGVETRLREGSDQGTSEDGRYAWSASVAPYVPPGTTPDMEAAAPAMAVRVWRIAVTVRWPGSAGSDRSVSLSTVRVAIKE